jgi:hypothetical protein
MDLAQRLDRRLDKSGECWVWTGYCQSRGGYGRIGVGNRKMEGTHRVAWELANGPIPPGMMVLHSCDVPACCNPAHLHLGTAADNTREMLERGRAADRRGERAGRAKLTEAQVLEIRERYAAGNTSYRKLAPEYGVSYMSIQHAVRRITWAHI